jgi:hypothetical protein
MNAAPELSISPEKAFHILVKAREFDEKTGSSGLPLLSISSDPNQLGPRRKARV